MASNAYTESESLSEASTLDTDTERDTRFDAGTFYAWDSGVRLTLDCMIYAEDTSEDVASFFQTMTMSTTRRLPAKNVVEGVGTHINLFLE